MTKLIEMIKMPRLGLIKLADELTIEQLNKVPLGFNNNIAWNLAHLIAAQQGVCYRRAGVNMVIDDAFFMTYKPDTKPERYIDSAEMEIIKSLLVSTIDQFETDLENNIFADYVPWTSRYGVEINNINEALNFLPFHEGLHLGYIWALRRAVAEGE
jgi:hypothetical protein